VLPRLAALLPVDREPASSLLPRDPVDVQESCDLPSAVVGELVLVGSGSVLGAQLAPAWALGTAGSAGWRSSGNSSWLAPATSSWTGPTAMPKTPWPRRRTSMTSSALVAA